MEISGSTFKTKTVTKTVVEEVKDGVDTLTITLTDPGEIRRFGRIMLGQATNEHYHGARTDEFARQVVDTFGFNATNTATR